MIDSNTFHIGDRVRLIYSRINEDILDVFSRELTDGDYDKYVPTGYVYSIHPEYIRLSNEPINKVPSWTGWISTAKYKYS
nr:hypothetical protein [Candidatus Woesearchaeota archaeon]